MGGRKLEKEKNIWNWVKNNIYPKEDMWCILYVPVMMGNLVYQEDYVIGYWDEKEWLGLDNSRVLAWKEMGEINKEKVVINEFKKGK